MKKNKKTAHEVTYIDGGYWTTQYKYDIRCSCGWKNQAASTEQGAIEIHRTHVMAASGDGRENG